MFKLTSAVLAAMVVGFGLWLVSMGRQISDLRQTANLTAYCVYDQNAQSAQACLSDSLNTLTIAAGK
jgi:hypothetical protein